MAEANQILLTRLQQRFPAIVTKGKLEVGELTIEVPSDNILELCSALRDEEEFGFEQLIDLCGVDYSTYGEGEWQGPRFAVVYHLLSVSHNQRLRVRAFTSDDPPRISSVIEIWSVANWYEREAFDLFGILFEGHPDLRRLLTDYGFIGHPFRKDFPLIGNVEMRYDPDKQRVVYNPVSIEPRITVPRVIRHDSRYMNDASDKEAGNG